jgi:hypothetical protein
MALNFIVESGVGDPDATSYVDVTFADDYADTNPHVSEAWAALEDPQKQALLIRATRYIDRTIVWDGQRVEQDSGLRWPRSGVYDADGFLIPSDVIPTILLEAVCEMAGYLIDTDWTAAEGSRGLKEIQVDVIELKFDEKTARGSLPDFVISMLEELGQVKRGRSPAFKKIRRT